MQSLEWTVNAYVLAYAVLLLTGAALGDRFGRRRMFLAGLGVFTLASAAAGGVAPTTDLLDRRARGAGSRCGDGYAAHADAARGGLPRARQGVALGVWSGVSGSAVAMGPLVGGAVVEGISWHWIFWINVPIGSCCCRWRRACCVRAAAPTGRSTSGVSRSPRLASSGSSSASCARSRLASPAPRS